MMRQAPTLLQDTAVTYRAEQEQCGDESVPELAFMYEAEEVSSRNYYSESIIKTACIYRPSVYKDHMFIKNKL